MKLDERGDNRVILIVRPFGGTSADPFPDQPVDVTDEVAALEARLKAAKKALDDIAKGMANAPDSVLEEGSHALTSYMWTWSQQTAREALQDCTCPAGVREGVLAGELCNTCKGDGDEEIAF